MVKLKKNDTLGAVRLVKMLTNNIEKYNIKYIDI